MSHIRGVRRKPGPVRTCVSCRAPITGSDIWVWHRGVFVHRRCASYRVRYLNALDTVEGRGRRRTPGPALKVSRPGTGRAVVPTPTAATQARPPGGRRP